jgi:hypothetical protein
MPSAVPANWILCLSRAVRTISKVQQLTWEGSPTRFGTGPTRGSRRLSTLSDGFRKINRPAIGPCGGLEIGIRIDGEGMFCHV